ncbi:hypothetical protein ccbrp13_37420 [Ktedonobacteria bacterium brp13]|nr:hypothetical protein ccbrp13_37420 [Ktedonobacteria bacterium brp13]
MASHSQSLTRKRRGTTLPASLILARKLFKQTWGLLLVIVGAMIVMTGSICAIPLFSNVVTEAGIAAATQPSTGNAISGVVNTQNPTALQTQQQQQSIDQLVQSTMGSFVSPSVRFSLSTPQLQIINAATNQTDPQHLMEIEGYDMPQIADQLSLIQGKLPQVQTNATTLQIAPTQAVAVKLNLHVGSTIAVRYPIIAGSTVWHLQVVGIVAIKSTAGPLLHNYNDPSIGNDGIGSDQVSETYFVFAPQQSLAAKVYALPINQTSNSSTSLEGVQTSNAPLAFTSGGGGSPNTTPIFNLYWDYPLNVAQINASNVSVLLQDYNALTSHIDSSSATAQTSLYYQSRALDRLNSFDNQLTTEQVLIVFFLLAIFGLALYMVSTLSTILVERQQTTITLLRSRGAVQSHITGAFTLQSLFLGVITLIGGPLCALLFVSLLTNLIPIVVPGALHFALTSVSGNPLSSMLSILWLALIVCIVVVVVMMINVRKATKVAIVDLRQENSRTTRVPLWRRLYLDFILALVLLAEGAFYYYTTVVANHAVGGRSELVLAPLILLGTPLVLIVVSLLALRFMPFFLRLGARIISRSNQAPGVLAFAQMERQPQTMLRMVLLIATSLAFSLYLLSFLATQQVNTSDNVKFQVGADFSGAIATASQTTSQSKTLLSDLQQKYTAIPGVASASVGYTDNFMLSGNPLNFAWPDVSVTAVNTDTYAQTAIWTPTYSTQSLATLTSQLAAHRADATSKNLVYAVVDSTLWNGLNLTPGAIFTLPTTSSDWQHVQFVALAEAAYLPHDARSSAGLLVDYQSYAAVYAKGHQGQQLQPNYVWLHAHNDASSLASIHRAQPDLQDLQTIMVQAQTDPLQLDTTSILVFGLIAILVLATIGIFLSAWLGITRRLTSFTLLRALGMPPRQIAATLLWEQGTTYAIALLLGLGIGWILTQLVSLAFPLVSSDISIGTQPGSSIQAVLPLHTVFPVAWVSLLFGSFVIICAILLLALARYAAQPTISQTLRLNED